MGLSGVSLPQLLILFLIIIAVFGTKKMRHLGEDLGAALKSFRRALKDEETPPAPPAAEIPSSQNPPKTAQNEEP